MSTKLPQGYEERNLIVTLAESDFSSLELSSLCETVDCSWDEAYRLADRGFIAVVIDESKKRVMASITSHGMWASEQIRKEQSTD